MTVLKSRDVGEKNKKTRLNNQNYKKKNGCVKNRNVGEKKK